MTGSDFRVLTKSSPESAPTEVMDSLLMVRGIRTLLRDAVAASSAIFFFNLANIAILSVSLFECNLQFLESKYLHTNAWSLRLLALRADTEPGPYAVPLKKALFWWCHFAASRKGKETIIKMPRLTTMATFPQQSVCYIETKNKMKSHPFWSSSYNRQANVMHQWQTNSL